MKKQVSNNHYKFSSYMNKMRWCSVWHQLDEVFSFSPSSVLEVGPGPGLFKAAASKFGLKVETLDIAEDLRPDHVASATDMPFSDKSYDVVCSFQMLEHLPFELSLKAMKEIARVAKKGVVISLPDCQVTWTYAVHIPMLGRKVFNVKKPFSRKQEHVFDGEHYWEINKKGFDLKTINKMINHIFEGFHIEENYVVPENPYHRFFVLKRV